jgi:very-short-patch-repair endonuclease
MLHHSYARQHRRNPSKAQKILWYYLRNKQIRGFKFRREHPIGNFILDFVCLERKLAIEIDGGQHAVQSEYDSSRSRWLQLQGFKVLRFWNNEVLVNTESVLDTIQKHL